MRLLRVLLCLTLMVASASATTSYLQSATTSNASSLAFGSDVAKGTILIAYYAAWSVGGVCPTSWSDTQLNSWSLMPLSTTIGLPFGNASCMGFALSGTAGADTVSFGGATTTVNQSLTILEYSAGATDGAIPSAITQSSGTVSSFTVTGNFYLPAGTAMRVVSCVFDIHSAHTWTSSGATMRVQGQPTGGESVVCGDEAVTVSSTSYSNTYGGASGSTSIFGSLLYLVPTGGASSKQVVSVSVQ